MIFNNKIGKHFSKNNNSFIGNKFTFISCISLLVLISMLFSMTFSWFTHRDIVNINTGAITVSATAGMRVNNGEDLSGIVKLATGVKLAEASSVDGRNMFFPTTGTFTSDTSSMVFREGNVGDRNVNYFYKDFSLKSDSGETDVYVKSYTVQVGDIVYDSSHASTTVCPLRISFITDSAETPMLIDPTARFGQYVNEYNAVDSISSTGIATTQKSVPHSFMEYYFAAGNPAFTIKENEELNITMVMWLEGTGGICDDFVEKNVSVDINFESNWDHMDIIEFVDHTIGDFDPNVTHWVNNDNCLVTLTYFDTKTNQNKTVMMTKSPNYETDYTWKAALPQGIVTRITFNRYNPNSDIVWNAWYTEPNVNNKYSNQTNFDPDLQESRIVEQNGVSYRCFRYEALGGNGHETNEFYRPYPCRGYWRVVENKTPIVDDSVSEDVLTSDFALPGEFNGWSTSANLFTTTDTVGLYTSQIQLSEGTYEFKVHKTAESGVITWYTNNGYSIHDNATDIELGSSGDNMVLNASGGTYTFILDTRGDVVKLTVESVLDNVEDDDDTPTTITIKASVVDHTSSGWVYNNFVNNSCTFHIVFTDSTSKQMPANGYGKFEDTNISVSSSAKIKGFVLKNGEGSVINTFYYSDSSQYQSLENDYQYNYKINTSDKLEQIGDDSN